MLKVREYWFAGHADLFSRLPCKYLTGKLYRSFNFELPHFCSTFCAARKHRISFRGPNWGLIALCLMKIMAALLRYVTLAQIPVLFKVGLSIQTEFDSCRYRLVMYSSDKKGTYPYYISPIEVGSLWDFKSRSIALGFYLQTDMK